MKEFNPEGMLIKTELNSERLSSVESIKEAALNGEIIEAIVVLCDRTHNLTVDLGCMKGYIEREEGAIGIAEGKTRDIALISRVGKPVCFKVLGVYYDEGNIPYALLSRKAAQEECYNYITKDLRPGDIIDAKVTHLESFGAFCDIGCGNIALLPIDSISVSRISHPSDRLSVGDIIKVIIKDIGNDGRITLTHKELLGTWEENAALFLQGQTVSGIVRSIEEYGVFVELTPNLAGLAEPADNMKIGEGVCVYIKSIIPEKMKIKLIIIDKLESIPKRKIRYYYEGDHIDDFCYSPDDCQKQISVNF